MTRLTHSPRPLRAPTVAVLDARSDGVLLARFLADGDAAAFATLVGRHTPAIRAACAAWLRSAADIDHAAQATFLVLVRRADTLRDGDRVGAWLCRVAGFVARRLRKELRRVEPLVVDPPARCEPPGSDRADLLAEEVDRLPEKYRVPVLMHYSAGLSTADIADRLGCPKGTVLTRLDRGRKLLERRLSARGWTAAALVVGAIARPLSAAWILATARGAILCHDGQSPLPAGVSTRSVTLTEGVIRAMTSSKLRYVLLALMLATGVGGFALGQFGTKPAVEKQRDPLIAPDKQAALKTEAKAEEPKPVKVDEAKPGTGRRREAVIKVPVGTFVKDVDAGEYGSGRLTWTFEEDKVLGTIEANVMGIEVELKTEAEFSLSGNGTIYGIVTSAEVTHLKVGAGALGEGVAEYAAFVKLAEPLINEMLTDLPFSYQFRISGDKLTILNYRALLAGPNPLGKIGGLMGGAEIFGAMGYFQALGLAIEGTYTAGDADPKEKPKAKPLIRKPMGKKASSMTLPSPRYLQQQSEFAPSPLVGALAGLPIAIGVGSPEVGLMPAYAQAEEGRRVGTKWRRFWFNDQPSLLSPERIHGGIGP